MFHVEQGSDLAADHENCSTWNNQPPEPRFPAWVLMFHVEHRQSHLRRTAQERRVPRSRGGTR